MVIDVSPETITASIGITGAAAAWLINLNGRLERLSVKIDTLWDFQLRRGALEPMVSGVATKNSPLTVREEFLAVSKELGDPLRDFYRKIGRPAMTNAELAFQIERHFGSEIVDKVCIPHGLSYGACLIIAIAVAKGDPTVDV